MKARRTYERGCLSYLAALLFALTTSVAPAESQSGSKGIEVKFRNGEVSLAGLWFEPAASDPHPAAVFIRGSGPSSRDSYWARAIIDVMLLHGFAVLLPDKRGSNGSEGDWRDADFETLASDTLGAVRFARRQPNVIAERVGVVGLSQGGKIAPIAAAASDEVAFVVNFSGSATNFTEQVSWEMYHTLREAGLTGGNLLAALELQVTAEAFVRGNVEWATYRRKLQAALRSEWASAAEGFPQAEDAWQWDYFRRVVAYDPVPYWRQVRVPLLVFYGEKDHNTPAVRSAYRLTRVFLEGHHPDWTVRVIPGAGHGLWEPGSAHGDALRLHNEVITVLGAWLDRLWSEQANRSIGFPACCTGRASAIGGGEHSVPGSADQ